MIIAITGASGMIGRALVPSLTAAGHEVRRLVQRAPAPREIGWDPATGRIDAAGLTGVDAVVHLAVENIAAGRWTSVYLIGEDVGRWGNLFGASAGLLQEFGWEHVKDSPISEAALMGCAVGSAIMGMRPIAEIMYIDFITIAMDQIVNHAVKYHQLSNGQVKVPVTICTQGGIEMRNSSQHSQSLENWFVQCARYHRRHAVHAA